MKKILLIAALVGTCTATQAKILAFGIKAGVNAPSLKTDLNLLDEAKAERGLGFHAGVFGQVNIPIIGLGVQPELLYLNQSISYVDKDGKTDSKGASYLDIPINITWGIDFKVVRPFIALTPYMRYSFSDIKTWVNSTGASSLEQKLNKFDYGLGVGAGIDLFSKFQLMGRYSWGLSDLVKDYNYKVRSFTVSLGYIF